MIPFALRAAEPIFLSHLSRKPQDGDRWIETDLAKKEKAAILLQNGGKCLLNANPKQLPNFTMNTPK
ncbi:MAG: hypothetical protein ACOYYS_14780 [Chloroflexota bacterium]